MRNTCIFCSTANLKGTNQETEDIYSCELCGQYIISHSQYRELNKENNKTISSMYASYMFYNKIEYRAFYIGTKEAYDIYLQQNPKSTSILLTSEMVENWYPKSFSDKIDLILLKLSSLSCYDGDYINIDNIKDALFFTKIEHSQGVNDSCDKSVQSKYILDYLDKQEYVKSVSDTSIQLLPRALDRIYELSKNNKNNKNAFIAMSFDEEYKSVMETIKQAICECGYHPQPICDVEHNNWIVPEIFHAIRQSRFVVVDLTANNNGAYYESGYAEGLGKIVIHVCKKDVFNEETHFDVKQKSTIIWNDLEELLTKLKRRIVASLGD